jgi:hypothetical protein
LPAAEETGVEAKKDDTTGKDEEMEKEEREKQLAKELKEREIERERKNYVRPWDKGKSYPQTPDDVEWKPKEEKMLMTQGT